MSKTKEGILVHCLCSWYSQMQRFEACIF